jgi:ankyrin repeat protein
MVLDHKFKPPPLAAQSPMEVAYDLRSAILRNSLNCFEKRAQEHKEFFITNDINNPLNNFDESLWKSIIVLGAYTSKLFLTILVEKYNLNVDLCGHKVEAHETPVGLAVRYGESRMLSVLVKHNANCKVIVDPETGDHPLHFAVKQGQSHLSVLLDLLDADDQHIDINAKNKAGQTPFSIAIANNYMWAVKYLIERGCSLVDVVIPELSCE